MKLIDKDALVAEIGRLNDLYHTSETLSGEYFIEGLFRFINTLEVKKVNLEKEISNYLYSHLGRPRMELELDWTQCDITCKADKLIAFAKHFFELGLAQKGE